MSRQAAEDRLSKLTTGYGQYCQTNDCQNKARITHDDLRRYLLAAAIFGGTLCVCLAAPPAHLIKPSVPLAPLIAATVCCRLLFGIRAGRLSAVLTGAVVGLLSYNQLADPGVSVWITGYAAALIGISIERS